MNRLEETYLNTNQYKSCLNTIRKELLQLVEGMDLWLQFLARNTS